MTLVVTDDVSGTSAEATGHPKDIEDTNCTEPVPGTVGGSGHSVTITSADGSSAPIATKLSTLHFDAHSHDYTDTEGCHNDQSHDLSGADFDDAKLSSSITINGEPVLIVADGVSTDPVTDGGVNVISTGVNNSVSESP